MSVADGSPRRLSYEELEASLDAFLGRWDGEQPLWYSATAR